MKLKLNYVVIPSIVILTAVVGSWLTSGGMEWYRTIALPPWTPPGAVIGTVWTVIFILSAISAVLVWNAPRRDRRSSIVGVFLANGALNAFWSYIFFSRHLLGLAVAEAAALGVTVFALIILIRPVSRLAAALLIPYAAWATFATYLAYSVWRLN